MGVVGILLSEILLVGISYIYAFRFWEWIFLQRCELVFIHIDVFFSFFFQSCFPVFVMGLWFTHLDGPSGTVVESWVVGFIH